MMRWKYMRHYRYHHLLCADEVNLLEEVRNKELS